MFHPRDDGPLRPGLRARRLRGRVRRAASTATRRTRPCGGRSWRSRTSSTAAPRAPTRHRATARASCCSCRTRSSARSSATRFRRPAATASPCASCRATRRAAAELEQLLVETVEAEGQRVVVLARRPGRHGARGARRRRREAVSGSSRRRRGAGARGRSGRLRAQALRDPPRRRARRRARPRDPELLVAHDRLQGDAHGAAAARLLPRPPGRAHGVGARPRALALLDQHVPELGARAPLPDDRPQRRDQHAARQRQLDARARVAARIASSSATTSPKVLPVVRPGGSDSATFDNVLELLVLAGRSLPHAMMMMIPEAYAGPRRRPRELQGFYAYHQCLMEAWDGPAAIAFTDGRVIGATLDRNGLRPGRWLETRGRLGRARVRDRRARRARRRTSCARAGCSPASSSSSTSSRAGSSRTRRSSERRREPAAVRRVVRAGGRAPVRSAAAAARAPAEPLRRRQLAFGYAQEDMKVILAPLARNAEEAVGSMGNDTPLAVLSDRKPLLYSYFKQLFAQVTNPPIDSIREAVVMSVEASVGSERNLLDETPGARAPARDRQPDPARRGARAAAPGRLGDLQGAHARHHLAGRGRARRAGARRRAHLRRGRRGARRRRQHPHPLRPRRRARARADPVAARGLGRAPPSRPRGHAAPGRARRRVGRAAQRAQRRRARSATAQRRSTRT